ncbi:MAG TPA: hypothetical protein VKU36_00075 [Candidatus Babeliales bacterium]|nr:hypothetical protein [Candidatus Babeliales bacterium]
MKQALISLLFLFPLHIMSRNEQEQEAARIESAYCKIIDELFRQARETLEEQKDIISFEWLKRPEIKELQNCMSDALILSFDHNCKNSIPEKLERYLPSKIQQEATQLFENNKLSSDGARQFFYLSHMICGLIPELDCYNMMKAIKNQEENETSLLKLKIQEQVRQHERKKEMRALCEKMVMGALPRKQ